MADADFREAATRRDQIVISCKHLRNFDDRERMCFQTIGRFFGVDGAIISSQARLGEESFRLIGRQSLLSDEKRMDRGYDSIQTPRTSPGNVAGTPRSAPTPTEDCDLRRDLAPYNPKHGLGKDYYWVSDGSRASRGKSRRDIRAV
jgi:hypothetical protein